MYSSARRGVSKPGHISIGGGLDESASLEAFSACSNSDIDSLADYAWPDKMPYNLTAEEVLGSLARNVANGKLEQIRDRERGAAVWNLRMAETHARRMCMRGTAGMRAGLFI